MKKKRTKIFKYMFLIIGMPIILGFISSIIFIIIISNMKFTIDLSQYQPKELTRIYDANGELITTLYAEKRELVKLDELPDYVPNAFIAIEDRSFFSHKGVSIRGIGRALIHDIKTMSLSQGGSTLTQQLAKNMTNKAEKKFTRKLKEALFALKIEMIYTKKQILELYINQINYGYGIWGIAMASQTYFNKDPSELTIAEAALLAGLPQRPSYYNPFKHLNHALRRQHVVLRKMYNYGFITKQEYEKALKQKIIVKKQIKKEKIFAPYFRDYILSYLLKKYGYKATYNGGLKVYTTLRKDVQKSLEKALKTSKYQGGIVTLDTKTGAILGMVGGNDYSKNKFNRVVQAKRQCGSSFKIFLYTTYIKHRIGTLADLWNDTPIHFPGITTNKKYDKIYFSDEKTDDNSLDIGKILGWVPHDYSRYSGPRIVYDAIRASINIIAIKVLLATGIEEVIKTAHQMGIKSYLKPVVSLPLGANEVTPLEMAAGVCPLANGGYRIEPFAITRIENARGDIIEEHHISKRRVLDPQTVYVMDWALKGVVRHGTGRRAYIKGYPIAGKTGTTNNFTNAWFVGFTPNYATVVYIGKDNSESLGYGKAGGVVAAPIWRRAMKPILLKDVPIDFPLPNGIVFENIDRDTGLLATPQTKRVIRLPFIKGTEVTKYSRGKKEDLLWQNLKDIKWID